MAASWDAPKPKVVLMLVDCPQGPGGLVIDTKGYTLPPNWNIDDFEAVGSWYTNDKGEVYLELTNPIDALQDTLIAFLKKVRKDRIEKHGSPLKPTEYSQAPKHSPVTHARTVKETKPIEEPEPEIDVSAEFSSLRDRLKKKA